MARGGARAHTNVDRVVHAARLPVSADGGLFASSVPSLFCVDGNNLLWRAAHSPQAPFPADDGRDLTPLFRFITKLRRVLGTYGLFSECIVCFDGADAWSERVDLDAAYKANRDYETADLSFMGWLPEIKAALECMGITVIEVRSSEADDVIATLIAHANGRSARILSTDRDYYQLVSTTTMMVNPKVRPPLVGAEGILATYGVTPQQWCDFRTIAGDPSDGIPGLPGIGMTRAAALLSGGKTLDDLRDRPDVAERWSDLCRWRELIRLRTDVETGFIPSGEPTPRLPSPTAVCRELGLTH